MTSPCGPGPLCNLKDRGPHICFGSFKHRILDMPRFDEFPWGDWGIFGAFGPFAVLVKPTKVGDLHTNQTRGGGPRRCTQLANRSTGAGALGGLCFCWKDLKMSFRSGKRSPATTCVFLNPVAKTLGDFQKTLLGSVGLLLQPGL